MSRALYQQLANALDLERLSFCYLYFNQCETSLIGINSRRLDSDKLKMYVYWLTHNNKKNRIKEGETKRASIKYNSVSAMKFILMLRSLMRLRYSRFNIVSFVTVAWCPSVCRSSKLYFNQPKFYWRQKRQQQKLAECSNPTLTRYGSSKSSMVIMIVLLWKLYTIDCSLNFSFELDWSNTGVTLSVN